MNPEKDENAELAGKDNEFGNGTGSLTNNFESGMNNDAYEQQKELEKKFDEAFNDEFSNPETFFKRLFNKADPNAGAMEDIVEMLADRIDINKGAGIEPDLMQCGIRHDLHSFLENKGDTWQ